MSILTFRERGYRCKEDSLLDFVLLTETHEIQTFSKLKSIVFSMCFFEFALLCNLSNQDEELMKKSSQKMKTWMCWVTSLYHVELIAQPYYYLNSCWIRIEKKQYITRLVAFTEQPYRTALQRQKRHQRLIAFVLISFVLKVSLSSILATFTQEGKQLITLGLFRVS
jgi:hypothetical protein